MKEVNSPINATGLTMSMNEIDVNLRNGGAIPFDGRLLMTDVEKSGNLEVLSSISIGFRRAPIGSA